VGFSICEISKCLVWAIKKRATFGGVARLLREPAEAGWSGGRRGAVEVDRETGTDQQFLGRDAEVGSLVRAHAVAVLDEGRIADRLDAQTVDVGLGRLIVAVTGLEVLLRNLLRVDEDLLAGDHHGNQFGAATGLLVHG
jgi:hypothetical protein